MKQPAGPRGPYRRTRAGTNLRHLIGMHDLRREQFAAYVGISSAGLRDILCGRSEPSLATVRRMAAAFGLTVDDLYAECPLCLRMAAIVFEAAPIRAAARPDSAQVVSRAR